MNKSRITIMIDGDIQKALRKKQAKLIIVSTKSVSFSTVINTELRKVLKL